MKAGLIKLTNEWPGSLPNLRITLLVFSYLRCLQYSTEMSITSFKRFTWHSFFLAFLLLCCLLFHLLYWIYLFCYPNVEERRVRQERKEGKYNGILHSWLLHDCSISLDHPLRGHMSEHIPELAPKRERGKNLSTGSHSPLTKALLHEVLTLPHFPVVFVQALSRSASMGNPLGNRALTGQVGPTKKPLGAHQNQWQRQNK